MLSSLPRSDANAFMRSTQGCDEPAEIHLGCLTKNCRDEQLQSRLTAQDANHECLLHECRLLQGGYRRVCDCTPESLLS